MSILNEYIISKKELKKRIASCEEYLSSSNKYKSNVKELKRYRLKQKTLQYLREFYPTIMALGLIALFVPTVTKNGTKYPLITRETIDSTGNDKVMNSYLASYDKNADKITYVSKWELNEKNKYERIIKRYNINNISHETIKVLVSNEKTIDSMEDVFGTPISIEKELGVDLTEDEIDTPEYIEAVLYSKDTNDVITAKFSTADKIGISFAIVVAFLGVDYLFTDARDYIQCFNLGDELTDIDNNYLYQLNKLCDKETKEESKKAKTKKLKGN